MAFAAAIRSDKIVNRFGDPAGIYVEAMSYVTLMRFRVPTRIASNLVGKLRSNVHASVSRPPSRRISIELVGKVMKFINAEFIG